MAPRERDVAKRYVTALVEGIARARQDKAFTKQVIGKYTQTSEDDVLEETYERYVPKLLKPLPYVTPGGVQVGLEEFSGSNPQAASARPEQFYAEMTRAAAAEDLGVEALDSPDDSLAAVFEALVTT